MIKIEELNIREPIPLRGISIVEASAGTGKTYSITKIFLQAILSGIDIKEILVVTFTEAATSELRTRIRTELYDFERFLKAQIQGETSSDKNYLGISAIFANSTSLEDQLKTIHKALLDIDMAPINTIHGFCQRMLVENAFESKIAFGAELLTDLSEICKELAENFWRRTMIDVTEIEKDFLEDISVNTLQTLTQNFLQWKDVLLSNTTDESSTNLHNDLKGIMLQSKAAIAKYESPDEIEIELLEYYANFAEKLKGPFAEKKYEATIQNCMDDVRAGKCYSKKMIPLDLSIVEENIRANAAKAGFELPDADFFAIGTNFANFAQKSKLLKSALYKELYEYVHSEFDKIKDKRHILTFNDLIYRLYEVIKNEALVEGAARPLTELIRGKFKVALVDEFQDTDRQQYYIFSKIFGESAKHAFFMIGDPKQSIYKFRGADIFSYLKAKTDAEYEYTLLNNYRSEANMIAAVNNVFEYKKSLISEDSTANRSVFVYQNNEKSGDGIPFYPVTAGNNDALRTLTTEEGNQQALQLRILEADKKSYLNHKITIDISNEIVRLLTLADSEKAYFKKQGEPEKKEILHPGDIAILVNEHKQGLSLKRALNDAGVPSVIQNRAGIFQSQEAHDIKRWLQAVKKPIEKNIRALFITNISKKGFSEIDTIKETELLAITEELLGLQKQWQAVGFFAAFKLFMEKFQTLKKILQLQNGERIITNYFQLADLLHQYELRQGRNIEKLISYLHIAMQTQQSGDEFNEKMETDKKSVTIITIHKSKGLEFPIVFCPFLWEHSIAAHEANRETLLFNNDMDGIYTQCLDFKADEDLFKERQQHSRKEVLAEHIRMLYVSLTRAANRVYLYAAENKIMGNSAFAYLFTNNSTDFVYTMSAKGNKTSGNIAEDCIENMKILAKQNSDVIHLEILPKYLQQLRYTTKCKAIKKDFKIRTMNKRIYRQWGVSSFSGLISNIEYHGDPIEKGEGAFSLPSGKQFGTTVHKLFENYYNFGEKYFSNEKIKRRYFDRVLDNSGNELKKDEVKVVVEEMMKTTLNAKIATESFQFQLKDIPAEDAKTEFSFYHIVNKISPKLLKNIFAKFATGKVQEFAKEMPPLDFMMKHGYLLGEIDLLFRKDNRYFVLDWKTNHLGANFANYAPDKIEENMYKHYYLLQAHIYALATHLFLKQNLNNYDYDRHFGGFIYVYTRGVDCDGNGIYFNKPPRALIENLEYLCTHS